MLTIGLAVLTLLGMRILSSLGQSYFPIVEDSVGILRVEGPINESRDVIKVIKRYRENDMIKAIDPAAVVGPFRLVEKRGGKRGLWRADAHE